VNTGPVQADASSWLIEPSKSNVYKCRDKEGRIQYSDKVCQKGLRNTSKGWVSVEEEEKQKRAERELERVRRMKHKASAIPLNPSSSNNANASLEQNYRNLSESSRWSNPNSDSTCHNLVNQIRALENRSDYNSNKQVQREWSVKGDQAMRLGCNW
jgi:hypothetical protein